MLTGPVPPPIRLVQPFAGLTWSITNCGRSSVRLRLLHYDHTDPLTFSKVPFQWTSAADQDLHLLKLRFFSAPAFHILNWENPFMVIVDALNVKVGNVLSSPFQWPHRHLVSGGQFQQVSLFCALAQKRHCNYLSCFMFSTSMAFQVMWSLTRILSLCQFSGKSSQLGSTASLSSSIHSQSII